MLSLRDFLPERSASGQPASFRNLDFNNPSQLRIISIGALLVLCGSALRRSIIGLAMILKGGSLLHCCLTRAGESAMRGKEGKAKGRVSPMSKRTPGGGVPDQQGCKLVHTMTIDRPHEEVFRFVRNVENAPRYIKSVENVQVLDDSRSHWIARMPNGDTTEWYLEIINEHPGGMIAWQSLPGADLQHAGSIRFEPIGEGASTRVRVSLEFSVHESEFAHDVATILGEAPEQQLIEDLSRLKFLVEGGAQTLRIDHLESMGDQG